MVSVCLPLTKALLNGSFNCSCLFLLIVSTSSKGEWKSRVFSVSLETNTELTLFLLYLSAQQRASFSSIYTGYYNLYTGYSTGAHKDIGRYMSFTRVLFHTPYATFTAFKWYR